MLAAILKISNVDLDSAILLVVAAFAGACGAIWGGLIVMSIPGERFFSHFLIGVVATAVSLFSSFYFSTIFLSLEYGRSLVIVMAASIAGLMSFLLRRRNRGGDLS